MLDEDGIVEASDQHNSDALEMQTAEQEAAAASAPVFRTYRPLKVSYGQMHPEPIVESCSMASVEPPDVSYVPGLPHSLLHGERGYADPETGFGAHPAGALSAAQVRQSGMKGLGGAAGLGSGGKGECLVGWGVRV
jgi:hypothetical protein